MTPHESAQSTGAEIFFAVAATAALFVYAHAAALLSPYVVNDDVRQQIAWMRVWEHAEIFRDDPLTAYAEVYTPPAVAQVYRAASWVISPLRFSQLLPGALFIATGLVWFATGRRLAGRRGAWCLLGVYWTTPYFLDRMSGGLSRGFGDAFVGLLFFALATKSGRAFAASLIGLCAFVPHLGALGLVSAALGRILDRLCGMKPFFPIRAGHWAALAAAAGLLVWFGARYASSGFGPLPDRAILEASPEFGPEGRYPFLPEPTLLGELLVRPFLVDDPKFDDPLAGSTLFTEALGPLLLLGLLGLWTKRLLSRRAASALWTLLGASLLGYIAARVWLLKLFAPNRMLVYGLGSLYVVVLGFTLERTLRIVRISQPGAAILLAGALILGGLRLKGASLYDYTGDADLYAALAASSQAALVAGPPGVMDNVWTFAGRRVHVAGEIAHPWSLGFWGRFKPRLEGFIDAYYGDWAGLAAFCRREAIDLLVVDPADFTPNAALGGTFFEPLASRVRDRFDPRRHWFFDPAWRKTPHVRVGGRYVLDFSDPARATRSASPAN